MVKENFKGAEQKIHSFCVLLTEDSALEYQRSSTCFRISREELKTKMLHNGGTYRPLGKREN